MKLLNVSISKQTLSLYEDDVLTHIYKISTAKLGAGEIRGSHQTPRGWHCVRAKIGEGCPVNTVFVSRRPTGEIYSPELATQFPGRDWILTRIFWLSGLERGKNRLGKVDTMQRYIYFHGTPNITELGKPGSKGCIRMHNRDIVELFNIIPTGTRVLIEV